MIMEQEVMLSAPLDYPSSLGQQKLDLNALTTYVVLANSHCHAFAHMPT
jgi:hypothetical protein